MKSNALVAILLASLFSLSHAQFVVGSVPLAERETWCTTQRTACPLICAQINNGSTGVLVNYCTPETLAFDCTCGNNVQPNASEFSQTVPFFICQKTANICADNCGQDSACVNTCRTAHPCGAQNPERINATTTTTTASTTSPTGSVKTDSNGEIVYQGFGGSTGTPGTGGAARALAAGELYGLGLLVGGLFVGFTLFI